MSQKKSTSNDIFVSSVQDDCAFNFANKVISPKWNVNIILELVTEESSLSFSEIAQRIPEISPRMLSMRIKSLVENGVLHIIENPEKPKKVRYQLTESGRELSVVLKFIREWSLKYGDVENETCKNNFCRHGIAIAKLAELHLDVHQ
ncbi:MAG: helix-turn-helix transcriptional regulator [Candidatus Heimdallarchaeota archaeon]|nr:helix-turn-helix transcriptional regulator [Candidatus Heimdallarchaeota archaeon]